MNIDPQITLSIITVTLNNLDGLRRTSDSLAAQGDQDYEWIIIDGASQDGTPAYLETIQDQFPLNALSERDNGIYEAMNKGLKHANGAYVLFLNAGDTLVENKTLASLIEVLKTKRPDFLYGDSLEPREDKKTPFYKPARSHTKIHYGMFTHHQAMIYARQMIEDHALHYSVLYDIAGDYDFTARFLKLCAPEKILYWPHAICVFERGGISMQNAYEGRREQYIIRENLGMVSQGENVAIFIAQSLLWSIKRRFPDLYEKIKGRR
jgi:putative colanic acid biosynthesis glycosyltransferase